MASIHKKGPKLNLYQLLNTKERKYIEEHLGEGNPESFLAQVDRFLRSESDIFFLMAPNTHPLSSSISSLFGKIKERCKDNTYEKSEEKIIEAAEKSQDETRPEGGTIHKFYTLTKKQVEQLMDDRKEHLQNLDKQQL